MRIKLFFIVLFSLALSDALAQSRSNVLHPDEDPRGAPELVICTQNLNNYGVLKDVQRKIRGYKEKEFERKEKALIERFADQQCDIIAVQEVLGSEKISAEKALLRLATLLQIKTNRFFEVRVGPSNDKWLQNGFLVAMDRATIVNKVSYFKVELPRLIADQKPRMFSRGPLELQVQVKGKDDSIPRTLTLVNFHFKSKRGEDPALVEWETYRMEMAEALRRILEARHKSSFANAEPLLVVLGDRNSHIDTASAKILNGTLHLKDFQDEGICRLSKRGVPLCQPGIAKPQTLFSVLMQDPEAKVSPGSYHFNDIYSWLDDILMPADVLPFAKEHYLTEANYDTGVSFAHKHASDHGMPWVKLNW